MSDNSGNNKSALIANIITAVLTCIASIAGALLGVKVF